MRRICVFAGSKVGVRPEYSEAAQVLGQELVKRGLGLVYGGASVGLMGVIANAVLAEGGEVIGVLPRGLFLREIPHNGLTEMHEVSSMHERKSLMADLADGFIALPGGFGTFDELFEIITWAQLQLHNRPVGLLNTAGYFEPLLALMQHASKEGFIPEVHLSLLICEANADLLLDRFAHYAPGIAPKWAELPPER